DNAGDAADGNYGPGQLTFREAVGLANSATGGADTITFSPAVFAGASTIDLSGSGKGTLALSAPVVITGPGSGLLTLTGAGAIRLFNIDVPGSSANPVSLSGLTLTGGNSATGSAI